MDNFISTCSCYPQWFKPNVYVCVQCNIPSDHLICTYVLSKCHFKATRCHLLYPVFYCRSSCIDKHEAERRATACEIFASIDEVMNVKNAFCNRHPLGVSYCKSCTKFEIPSTGKKFKICSGCKKVRYCSKECQNTDWSSGHKILCKALSGNATGEELAQIPNVRQLSTELEKIESLSGTGCKECLEPSDLYLNEAIRKHLCSRLGCKNPILGIVQLETHIITCIHNPAWAMPVHYCSEKCRRLALDKGNRRINVFMQ